MLLAVRITQLHSGDTIVEQIELMVRDARNIAVINLERF